MMQLDYGMWLILNGACSHARVCQVVEWMVELALCLLNWWKRSAIRHFYSLQMHCFFLCALRKVHNTLTQTVQYILYSLHVWNIWSHHLDISKKLGCKLYNIYHVISCDVHVHILYKHINIRVAICAWQGSAKSAVFHKWHVHDFYIPLEVR